MQAHLATATVRDFGLDNRGGMYEKICREDWDEPRERRGVGRSPVPEEMLRLGIRS